VTDAHDPRDWRQGPWDTYEEFVKAEGPWRPSDDDHLERYSLIGAMPTLSGGNLDDQVHLSTTEVWECDECGAAVFNPAAHSEWHRRAE
jgi:hypothetical protein